MYLFYYDYPAPTMNCTFRATYDVKFIQKLWPLLCDNTHPHIQSAVVVPYLLLSQAFLIDIFLISLHQLKLSVNCVALTPMVLQHTPLNCGARFMK